MKEYIFTLAAVAAVTSIALSLSHSDMKKPTGTALGILVLCAIAAPIGGLVASLSDAALGLPGVDSTVMTDECEDTVCAAFEDGIASAVAEHLGQEKESVEVRCDGFNMSEMRADKIHVRLTGTAALADPHLVRQYVKENFTEGGECTVELIPW
ncbi:MAG: hypothetical protein IJX38_05340 [Clostridia bacterium]|nr:hypothetical protein [Clostridia bacterium]